MYEQTSGPGPVSRARWYLNRLRCMSPAEFPHRVARLVSARAEARGLRRDRVPPARLAQPGCTFVTTRPAGIEPARYVAAAERIVAGRLDVFALRDVELGDPPRWNRDPKTGVEAPLTYGKTLNYRDPAIVGDIKYLWEPNRHQHLVTLAQAWRLTGDERFAAALRRHVDSWIEQCPCAYGANWASALEPALRLVNWSLAWQLLGGADSPVFAGNDGRNFRDRWLRSVFQHARFVRGFFSRHSSANNHLIGEAAGLYIATLTWPHWRQMRRWQDTAAQILEREILLQNGADGVNREQALAYQQFELDLLLLCWLAGESAGRPLSGTYRRRVESMLEFIAAVLDVGGNVPMTGDSDDGYVVRLAQEDDFCPYRSLLASGAVLYRRDDFRIKARHADDKTRWLLGTAVNDAWQDTAGLDVMPPPRRAFPDGGYYLLGCDFETTDEIRLLADAGPLGYREIAAHGHADALSFTLSVAGEEFLVDPGTYAYHADDRWRDYFRGTSAHNTVRVDGLDQSEPGGNFMWLRKARARCLRWEPGEHEDLFRGTHDGYTRLPDPVIHTRTIRLDKSSRQVVIEDELRMQGHHDIELYFHCSEHCRVEAHDGGYLLHGRRSAVNLQLPRGGHSAALRGSDEPPLGWISRRYDIREPCTTLVWRATLSGAATLTSVLQC